MEEYEKSSLDLENIYSSTKQKTRLIQTINKKSKELEKERDLILSLDYGNSDNGRVKVLQILTELEQEKYIKINGFCVYPLTNNGFHSDSGIKVNLTMEKKLKNFIIKIEQEKAINTADNNNNNSFDKNDPYTFTKKNLGHFTIGKGTKSILIGKKDSRHFRLLQCLCEPHFGVEKTIEGIFEAIRKDKDNKKRDLQEYSPQSKNRK
ncbi:MAG TPA: hypothetical protein P5052_01695 [Candidatus Paceibacterota bacterium]|nr:hypothetical protein [Candidatus Paceibacterota bacterium]